MQVILDQQPGSNCHAHSRHCRLYQIIEMIEALPFTQGPVKTCYMAIVLIYFKMRMVRSSMPIRSRREISMTPAKEPSMNDASRLDKRFAALKAENRPALVTYTTAGASSF